MSNNLPYSSRLSRKIVADKEYVMSPDIAALLLEAEENEAKKAAVNRAVEKIFVGVPVFCAMLVCRVIAFIAAIALTIWGFAHGPLWCLVAVFIHFPLAFWLFRFTFSSWKSKEAASIPEISL